MAQVLTSVRRWSSMPIAIQFAHAGRKASCDLPWKGRRANSPDLSQRLADRRAVHLAHEPRREPAYGVEPQ